MAPFAGDAVAPGHHPAADRDAGAASRADDDAEHQVEALARAIRRLRKGEAIGVVGQADRPSENPLEVGLQRLAVEVRGVGVADQPVGGRGRTGDAGADAGVPGSRLTLGLGDQLANGLQAGLVAARRWNPHTGLEAALGVERRRLDLGSAEVHADPDHGR